MICRFYKKKADEHRQRQRRQRKKFIFINNDKSLKLLKFSALGLGLWYGVTRKYTLESYVKRREEEAKNAKYKDLVEEGKILFEAHQMKELAKEAKKAHSKKTAAGTPKLTIPI